MATERGPAWPAGAGEARGALEPFLCKFVSEKNQIKTRESLVAVCRESSEDRVGFPESQRDHLCSRRLKLNRVLCGFLLAERRSLPAHGEGEVLLPGAWEPSVVSRIQQSPA